MGTRRPRAAAFTALAALVVACFAALFTPAPSRAAGLDAGCDVSTPTPTVTADAPTMTGVGLVFKGVAPPGMPVGAWTTNRQTLPDGSTSFELPLTLNTTNGLGAYANFLGDPTSELGVEFSLSSSTGGGRPNGLRDLFAQNFGLRPDAGPEILVGRFDVTFFYSDAFRAQLAQFGGGFRGELGVEVNYRLSDGSTKKRFITIALDSRAAGAKLPNVATVSLAYKGAMEPGGPVPTDYLGLGQYFDYGTPADADQPALGVGLTIDERTTTGSVVTTRPATRIMLNWAHAPRVFAAGTRQTCKPWDANFASTGQFGWSRTAMANPATNTVDVEVRNGIGIGIGGGDGTVMRGRVAGIPGRLDWVGHPRRLDLVHSDLPASGAPAPTTASILPTVDLDELRLATDDPAVTTDRPLLASGRIQKLPPHVRIAARNDYDAAGKPTGPLSGASIQVCPALAGPASGQTDAYPETGKAIFNGETEQRAPSLRPGCTTSTRAERLRAVVQDFVPGEVNTAGADDLATAPAAGNDPFVLWSSQAPRVPAAPGEPKAFGSPSYYRAGVQLDGVRGAEFTTADAAITAPDTYLRAVVDSTGGTNARILIRRDGRDRTLESRNTGTLTHVDAVAASLAPNLRLVVTSTRLDPFHAEYLSDVSMPLSGTARIQLPGREPMFPPGSKPGTAANLSFEVGAGAAGALPRAASMTYHSVTGTTGVTNGSFSWDADASTRIRAGGVITDRADRNANVRTRIFADAVVPTHLFAHWQYGVNPNAQFDHVEAVTCGQPRLPTEYLVMQPLPLPLPLPRPLPSTTVAPTTVAPTSVAPTSVPTSIPKVPTIPTLPGLGSSATGVAVPGIIPIDVCDLIPADNRVRVVAQRGTAQPTDAQLLSEPTLPAVPTAPQHPGFTAWGDEGVRAVLRADTPNSWGVAAGVRNIVRASYQAGPARMCLSSSPTGQPFTINVFDGIDATTSLFGDLQLNRLPARLSGRFDAKASETKPYLWLAQTDCGASAPPLTEPSTAKPTGIRIGGVVRYGTDAALARTAAQFAPLPTGLTRAGDGIDAVAGVYDDGIGLHTKLVLDLPRHLAVWQPTSDCNALTRRAQYETCQNARHYELNDRTSQRIRYWSTARRLGDDLSGVVRYAKDGRMLDSYLNAKPIPGSFDANVAMTTNRRLPWTDVGGTVTTNSGLDTIEARIYDRNKPAYRGDPDNRVTAAQQAANLAPNYRVRLQNVPSTLRLDAKLRSAEVANVGPKTAPVCPGEWAGRGPSELAYVDADFDLGGKATELTLRSRSGRDASDAYLPWRKYNLIWAADVAKQLDGLADATPHTGLEVLSGDVPVSGYLRFKQLNNTKFIDEHKSQYAGPIYLGTNDVHACVDFDLPLELRIDNLRDTRFTLSGARGALDMATDDVAAGGIASGRIGERYTCWTNCPSDTVGRETERLGAYYAYQNVRFDPVTFGDWSETRRNAYKAVGVIPGDRTCKDLPCYDPFSAADNLIRRAELTPGPRVDGFQSMQWILDPFFSQDTRRDMWDRDEWWYWPGRPGGEFYNAIKASSELQTNFGVPSDIGKWWAIPASVGTRTDTCAPKEPSSFAVLADATVVQLVVFDECVANPLRSTYRTTVPYLVARDPFTGQVRWMRAVETSRYPGGVVQALAPSTSSTATPGLPSPLPAPAPLPVWQFNADLQPADDGSLAVRLERFQVAPGTSALVATGDVRVGTLDASGRGGFSDGPSVVFSNVPATAGSQVALVRQPTPSMPFPANGTRVWYFGDGDTANDPAGVATGSRSHVYDIPGQYRLMVVDYDPNGKPVAWFTRRVDVT